MYVYLTIATFFAKLDNRQCEYIWQLWFLFYVIVTLTASQFDSHSVTLNLATVFVYYNYAIVTHIATSYLTMWHDFLVMILAVWSYNFS